MEAGALDRPLWIQTDEHSIRERAVDHEKSLEAQSDEELVELCKRNDHEAFTVLVDRYKNRIHWLVHRMVGGLEDEDFTQEVFLRVYQAFPSFRSGSKFSTWIYKIAHNLCLSELRKRKRRGEHLSMEEEGEEKVHWLLRESGEDLEEQIERRDFSRSVRELVQQLPPPHRTALTLFYVNQVRYEEIAEIMNIPMGTVKTYIHRARMRLRDLILAEPEMVDLVGQSATDMTGTGGQSG